MKARRIRISWNKEKPEEVALAKQKFEEYLRQGWFAFKFSSDNKKTLVLAFDPALEKILLIPASEGG